jgi:NAD(P)-dependent dehydrogenase (short-subunit alcohol dehydrogenase family)
MASAHLRAMGTVLITGGHAGLGLACANELASVWRSNLILAGRSPEKMQEVADDLRTRHGVCVDTLPLDVGSLASVRSAATEVRSWLESGKLDSLQAVVCNAGAQFHGPVSFSPEGYEKTFAVNHLGHFLLVNLLLDDLIDGGRIVLVASGTHDPETTDGKLAGVAVEPDAKALAFEGKAGRKPISPGKRYTTSKLCTMLFAYELHRRLRRSSAHLASIAVDPGWIPETSLVRDLPRFVVWLTRTALMKWLLKAFGITMGSLGFSGAALARTAADPEYANRSGKYLQSHNGTFLEVRSSKVSYDESRAAKLWQDSEELVAPSSLTE